MIKKFRLSLFFFFLILLTVGNYADAEIRANSQMSQIDTITEIVSTFLGEEEYFCRIAVDKDGYIIVALWNYIIKLNPAMTAIEYSRSFEGVGIRAITLDENGRIYITGGAGPGLPVTPDALYPNYSGDGDGFILILNPDGTIDYCSYFGGSDGDYAKRIVVDREGYISVGGYTQSLDFPVFNALYPDYSGDGDAFVIKFNPGGRTICYSTYLGGSDMDSADGVATDQSGNAYVTGLTYSSDFPISPDALDKSIGTSFVTKINPTGTALVYSTYWKTGAGIALAIAADRDGNAYVTGWTNAGGTSTPNAYDTTKGGLFDAFVFKLSPDGTKLIWSTYLGGDCDSDDSSGNSGNDGGTAIAVDTIGNVYVTGWTICSNFPVTSGAYDSTINGDRSHWWLITADIFLSKFSPDGRKLLYSTYFGGSQGDSSLGIAVDDVGDVYIIGETSSPDFPVTSGVYDNSFDGALEVFATKFFLSRLTSLIISSTYGGTTNLEPKEKDAYNYKKGTQAQIEAIPNSGYEFTGWTGDIPSGHEKDNPLILVMDSDKSITANFKVTPSPNDPNKSDKKCFVATAAYGSPLHPYIQILRDFRDEYLMTSKFGREIVDFYYKHSPPIADFIGKHKALKIAVRITLLPLVAFSYSMLHFSPVTSMLILSIFPILFFYQKRKKRKKAKARF